MPYSRLLTKACCIALLLFSFPDRGMSQCTGGSNAGALSMSPSFQTVSCVSAGDYFTFTATVGNTYIFSFCQGGGSSPFDTELTLLDNAGTPVPGMYNDFACNPGNLSEITWVATASGTFRILTTEWPCFPNSACATLAYREVAPVGPGADCSNPLAIAGMPFSQNGMTTCGAVDDYSSADACGSSYMNGEDLVLSYNSPGNECLEFTLANTGGLHGLFVMDGCPDLASTNCIAQLDAGQGNVLPGVSLTTPGTYYFVVSSADPPAGCINFDLNIDHCPSGADCADPRPIAALPFTENETTCGFGDDYSSSDACSSTYMNGDDFVYAYNSAGNECIDVFLSGTQSWTGVFLLDGCPDAGGTNCIANNFSPFGNPPLPGVFLSSPGTYYIVVSTQPSPQCTDFTISVDTCQPPAPCGNNPPANDLCANAPDISGYGSVCGSTDSSFYNAQVPGNINSAFCGVIDNNSWYQFTADSTTVLFQFTVGPCLLGLGIQAMVFETPDCINFSAVSNCFNPGTMVNGTVSATGLTVGNTYYLMVDGQAKDDCEYTFDYNSGVLPVEFGQLRAYQEKGRVRLDWETFSEENNEGFYVELGEPNLGRGEEGGMAWREVGFVGGKGNSHLIQSYSWEDSLFGGEKELYFRLRQVDLDGFSSYSGIVSLLAEDQGFELSILPNPVRQTLVVNLRDEGRVEGSFQVFDVNGRVLAAREVNVGAGSFGFQLDVSQFSPGLYFYQWISKGRAVKSGKLLKASN